MSERPLSPKSLADQQRHAEGNHDLHRDEDDAEFKGSQNGIPEIPVSENPRIIPGRETVIALKARPYIQNNRV